MPQPDAGSTPGTGGSGGTGGSTTTPDSGVGGSPADGGADGGSVAMCEPVRPAEGDFTKAKLLVAAADCVANRLCQLTPLVETLDERLENYANTLSPEHLQAARDAWLGAMETFEVIELFRFGPAAPATQAGGADLRDHVYAWPLFSRCKIEEQLVSRAYTDSNFTTKFANARGFGALEYLLYYPGSDNACSPFSVINAEGSWTALPPAELTQRKADYARAVGADIVTRVKTWREAFQPGADFRQQFVTAGHGSTVYATEQAALNQLSDALFYLDKEVKDSKLARPLGLLDCTSTRCPEALESLYARVGAAHLRANLRGFRTVFQGCGPEYSGLGFDDWLVAVGKPDLAERMLAALAEAERLLAALDVPIEQALSTQPERVQEIHAAVKAVTDLLKTEFVTVLNLELPLTSVGDND